MAMPKALVPVCGRRLIEWQLDVLCAGVDDVVLVVGFKGDELAAVARSIRPSIEIRVNERWAETKTGGSLSVGAQGCSGRVLSLDGDLLVAPSDFQKFVALDHDAIGVYAVASEQPVYADVDGAMVCHGFSYETPSLWEWSGLVNFNPASAQFGDGNVYEIVESIVPVSAHEIRCAEIDTAQDLARAELVWPEMVEA